MITLLVFQQFCRSGLYRGNVDFFLGEMVLVIPINHSNNEPEPMLGMQSEAKVLVLLLLLGLYHNICIVFTKLD